MTLQYVVIVIFHILLCLIFGSNATNNLTIFGRTIEEIGSRYSLLNKEIKESDQKGLYKLFDGISNFKNIDNLFSDIDFTDDLQISLNM